MLLLLLFFPHGLVWVFAGVKLSYDTAGFRADASVLSSIKMSLSITSNMHKENTHTAQPFLEKYELLRYTWQRSIDDILDLISEDNHEVEAYNQNIRWKELFEPFYSLVAEDRIKKQLPLATNDAELKSNSGGQYRSKYMHTVMSPLENLTNARN